MQLDHHIQGTMAWNSVNVELQLPLLLKVVITGCEAARGFQNLLSTRRTLQMLSSHGPTQIRPDTQTPLIQVLLRAWYAVIRGSRN